MAAELVSVTWVDSLLMDRYVAEENGPFTLTTIETVGFIVQETDDLLAVARETQHNGVWRGLVVIPKFAITGRKQLRLR